jgi:hypothetical protein
MIIQQSDESGSSIKTYLSKFEFDVKISSDLQKLESMKYESVWNVSSSSGISTKENFNTGLKFSCGNDIHFDRYNNNGYLLENCGEFDNKLIRFKLSETYKISNVETMFFQGVEFSSTKKGQLMMCE